MTATQYTVATGTMHAAASADAAEDPHDLYRLANRQTRRDMVREADTQIAAGRVGPFDAEQTKDAVRKRIEAHRIHD